MIIDILIRSLALVITLTTILPRSYQEWQKSDGYLGNIPSLILIFWILAATFVLSSIFFIYLGVKFLGRVDSLIILVATIVWMMIYRGNNISDEFKKYFEDK